LAGAGGLLSCGAVLCAGTIPANAGSSPQQRRQIVLSAPQSAAGLPALMAALKDPNALIRRAAVRSLGQIGAPAVDALTGALKNDSDLLVRRTALRALLEMPGAKRLAVLQAAGGDSSEIVRATAVEALAETRPRSPQVVALLEKAQQDTSPQVSRIASQSLWPFNTEGVALRETPQFQDTPLNVVQTIPLPEAGWRFHTDARQIGHKQSWFQPTFNDSQWPEISIGKTWEVQGEPNYDGVAWYRATFTLPAKPAQAGTDLVFEGVDESAWVWLNGRFIGAHDIGPEGWNKRFAMNVSDELKWGGANQITVRVLDRMMAGGIWKPVYLEVLKR